MIRDYLYIDERRLDLLVQQITTVTKETSKRQKKVGLSITGPSVELSEEVAFRNLSVHEKVEALIKHLREANLLDLVRPQELPGDPRGRIEGLPFVLETTHARKVIIPHAQLAATPGIKHLAVWIADPDPTVYSQEEWIWRGTFLYLTELWLDDKSYGTVWSGCSALQAIVNAAKGKDLDDRKGIWGIEPFGRGNHDHPLKKLESLGARLGDVRQITALYKKRYFTNEQCYTWNGQERRVNDLLGYPIFIADASGDLATPLLAF